VGEPAQMPAIHARELHGRLSSLVRSIHRERAAYHVQA
jgi:hypothetical protein